MTLETTENIAGKLISNKIKPNEFIGYKNDKDALNILEAELINYDIVECPVKHNFTPNLYTREIFMPAGTIITSLLHLTTHPFFILKGDVSVWYHDIPAQRYKAPYSGITKAGTRRLLYIHEDTIWVTCHVTDLTDPDEIGKEIMCTDCNPYLNTDDPKLQMWKNKNKEEQLWLG